MKVKSILENICGIDETGQAKAMLGVTLSQVDAEGKILKEIASCSVYKPIINIYPMADFVQIDLDFLSDMDINLKKIWDITQRYLELNSEEIVNIMDNSEIEERFFAITFDFLPFEGENGYFIKAVNPLLTTLTATETEKMPACIRMLFNPDYIRMFEVEDADYSDIDIEIATEMRNRDEAEKRAEEERERKKEWLKHLDKIRKGE